MGSSINFSSLSVILLKRPLINKYPIILMACSRSSLALSKNIFANPGRLTVSLEKCAP